MDALLTTAEAAAVLKIAKRTMDNWRRAKKGPPYKRIEGSVRYLQSELAAWVDSRMSGQERE